LFFARRVTSNLTVLSEFYSLRRNAITDLSAFFGFLAGFLGSTPIAWPYLQVGFQTQEIVKGFAWFIAITFGSGVALGIVGLGAGRILGSLWEGGHRVVRRARGREFAVDDLPEPVVVGPHETVPLPGKGIGPADIPEQSIRLAFAVDAHELIDLARRSGVDVPDPVRLQESLGRTINIGAYDGDQLVGALRMLTDGYEWTVVTDFLVEPSHRRRGIGSALWRRAADRATGRLAMAQIPPGTEGFFRRLEAMPAYEGFVRGAKSRLQ
jgi:predicted N-acetyltransferase YhbS